MADSTSGLPAESGVGRVALRVGDLDRMVEFYESVVGLTALDRGDGRAVLGAGGDPLLVLDGDPDAPERTADQTGLFHTAFLVPSRGALGAALDRVDDAWRLTGAADHHVSEAIYLRDPEDNGIEIYRDRPREEWPTTADGRVEMDTLPLDLDRLRRPDDAALPAGTTVGHVHLEVSSLAATREFYVDTLGLRVRQRMGEDALFLATDDYHHHLGANVWNHRTEPAGGRGLAWFEFVVPDDESVTLIGERLERAGHDRSPVPAVDSVGFQVDDPDGIAVRVRSADSE